MRAASFLRSAAPLLSGLAGAATLEERLRRQQDLQEIGKLLRDCGCLLDARDFDGYAARFKQRIACGDVPFHDPLAP